MATIRTQLPEPATDRPPEVRDTASAEEYVQFHAGVHGIDDLAPSEFEWRNDVARITVRRVRQPASGEESGLEQTYFQRANCSA